MSDQFNIHGDVIARHNHFGAFRQFSYARNVGRSEVELRTVAIEERSMTAAFFFGQYVNLTLEFRMRMDRARFGQNLTAFDFVSFNTAEQGTDVVTGFSLIQGLTEHFKTRSNGLFLFFFQTNDFHGVADFDDATFNTARCNRTTAGDGEDVFDRHQERFREVMFRSRDVFVNSIHQFEDVGFLFRVAFQGFQCGTDYDRNFISRIVVLAQQFTNFHFNQFDQFRIVNLVGFIQEYNDGRYANLTGKQDVFAGLGHRAVSCGNNEDSAVHLSSTGDHVLDIVGVARAVNVSIMSLSGFVFNVRGVDGDSAFSFFRSLIDHVVVHELGAALFSQHFGDGSGQGRLAMVNVTNGTNVNMGFSSFKFLFSHCTNPPKIGAYSAVPLFLATIASAMFLGTSS